ncbi:protein FAR1-RELATED SEQUENCE 5-like [Cornus florida]|uniref:protein FAR1-RELATED SEQUENCE 5-like n=1 Tax=Cornus florida TaxID=4283 RepID=UPI0028A039F4|nr:protein FAR1-RELATED SEQUENCE 5-like [Cornus florida]
MAMEDRTINIDETDNESDCEVHEIQWKPCLEMEFDSENAAYDFYNNYGGRVSFSIRKESKNKSQKNGKMTSRLFVCSNEGLKVHLHDTIAAKNQLSARYYVELGCDFGIAVRKAFELSSKQVRGIEAIGYTKVDVQNYIKTRGRMS